MKYLLDVGLLELGGDLADRTFLFVGEDAMSTGADNLVSLKSCAILQLIKIFHVVMIKINFNLGRNKI